MSLFCLDQAEQLVLHEGFEKFGVDLINHYDVDIHYHPDKANVAVDTLSRKSCPYSALTKWSN